MRVLTFLTARILWAYKICVPIGDPKKSGRGRPSVDSEPVKVRIERKMLDALDAWIAARPEPRPTRPEAIRRLLEKALAPGDPGAFIPIEDLNAENDE